MRKCATSLTPPSTGLSDIQFSTLNVLESLIRKYQKKYNMKNNNTEVGCTFYGRKTAFDSRCCDYKNSGKKSIPREKSGGHFTAVAQHLKHR